VRSSSLPLSYDEHKFDRVLFLQLRRHATNEEASKLLKDLAPTLEQNHIDGVSFVETPEKFGSHDCQEHRRSGDLQALNNIDSWFNRKVGRFTISLCVDHSKYKAGVHQHLQSALAYCKRVLRKPSGRV
jgi:hypothetical protein